MKIKSLITSEVYEIDLQKNGENKMPCPECSADRKKSSAKCFSFNADKGAGYCNHCNTSFVKLEQAKEYKPPKQYKPTEAEKNSEKVVEYFKKRRISKATLGKMIVYSKVEYMPQVNKKVNTIVFPYFRNHQIVNNKYRDGAKNFKLEKDAELIWYNFKALQREEVIITEGEIDALSFIEAGMDNVISVPNGANPVNMPYLDSTITAFENINKVFLAVDNDKKGLAIRDELARRIGFEKCYILDFKENKDANDCLVNGMDLKRLIQEAKLYPIEGLIDVKSMSKEIDALWEFGMKKGLDVGIPELDELITWESKRLAIITGTPASGKSELLDYINIKLNFKFSWKVGYWSPENYPITRHFAKLSEKLTATRFTKSELSRERLDEVKEYVQDNFFWIDSDLFVEVDEVLERAKFLIKSKGIKILVIDPYNRLARHRGTGKEYDFISTFLDKLTNFARKYDCLVQLVAHPKKPEKNKDGKYPMPTMYDIAGSGDFFNKADYGIAVRRSQDNESKAFINRGQVSIQKVKFKNLGEQGVWNFTYDWKSGRFFNDETPEDNSQPSQSNGLTESFPSHWDRKDWIRELNENPFELDENDFR